MSAHGMDVVVDVVVSVGPGVVAGVDVVTASLSPWRPLATAALSPGSSAAFLRLARAPDSGGRFSLLTSLLRRSFTKPGRGQKPGAACVHRTIRLHVGKLGIR